MDKKFISNHITHYGYMDSPLGLLMLAGCEQGLRLINFPKGSQARQPLPHWTSEQNMFTQAREQLRAYFDGNLQIFSVPLLLEGTPFQKTVWQALQNVPYGQLASYGDIAKAIGKSGAARAVGGANNANPIPIIVPCHRIIGADKSLTGFGGG
ncbi:MAG: methylated-DNA--[protein]-cysteine S-methyltransferase, partial [Robiginitomaculum sp.]|nr:methylated-DNA--[protein]-cysteine S-methyltransferase [Robiginitomaculum sp.]